ncbi:MAG TPA: TonB-dependent receptor [Thermomonas sp.]|nr:TonB-dependent receptor [Thermomonas sp.]
MSHTRSRALLATRSPLTLALALVLSGPAIAADPAVHASAAGNATPDPQRKPKDLESVEVVAERSEKPSSVKYTEPLLDIPQTITVVTKSVMDQQNLIGLRDILSTLPGITFGAGEGGGGYGDSINLRGFSASSDITVDGVRDSAQYTRSDNFNLEALELVNGANSAYSGAGSVGGNINLVSKNAYAGDASTATLGVGTDGLARLTADSNIQLDDGAALRLNAMAHRNDVPDRDVEQYERWGFASSFVMGLGSDTRATINLLHHQDDNVPEYGLPYFASYGGLLPGVDRESYFGYSNVDRQEIEATTLTGVLDHDFTDNASLRTLARLQRVDQLSVVNPTQGTWCLDSGINPATGASCTAPGTFLPSGPRGTSRDTRNGLAVLQSDLTMRFATGAVQHALVAGISLASETYALDSGNEQRHANGAIPTYPLMDLHDPDHVYTGPINYIRTALNEGELENRALYVFDTLTFSPRWELSLGARYENNEGSTVATTISGTGANLGQVTARSVFENEDNLFSYRAGLVFKPAENGSVYLSYANSKTPSKASVNGSCTAATCSVDPETAVNIELGTKWSVLGERLMLSAAVFRNERQDYKVADPLNPDNPSGLQQLDGQARVDGVALGIAGNFTREWSIFANYTYLDSEVLSGVSDYCASHPNIRMSGTTPVNVDGVNCNNSLAFPDPLQGNPLTNTPKHSASLWTTYQAKNWTFGYGLTYSGEFYLNNNSLPLTDPLTNTTPAVLYTTPDYVTHRAMAAYQVNDQLSLQLNLDNLADKQYFTRIRNNGWATPGAARSAALTATYRF